MQHRRISLSVVGGLVVAASLLGGCRPKLEPDKDAVLYYLRAVPIHGEVRRLWPEGQEHMNRLLEEHAKFLEEMAPLVALLEPGALWPLDDPRWTDQGQVQERLAELKQMLIDGQRKKRQELLSVVQEGLAAFPLPDSVDRQSFQQEAEQALANKGLLMGTTWAEALPMLEELAGQYQLVCRKMMESNGNEEAKQPHLRIAKKLAASEQQYVDYANEQLTAAQNRQAQLDPHKQHLENKYLNNFRKFQRETLEGLLKDRYAQMKAHVDAIAARVEDGLSKETGKAYDKQRESLLKTVQAVAAKTPEIRSPGDLFAALTLFAEHESVRQASQSSFEELAETDAVIGFHLRQIVALGQQRAEFRTPIMKIVHRDKKGEPAGEPAADEPSSLPEPPAE